MQKDSRQKVFPPKLIGLLHNTTRQLSRRNQRKGRLRHARQRVLMLISEKGIFNQNDLLAALELRPSSLSEVLQKLEEDEVIVREKCPDDKRAYILSLTDKGRQEWDEADKQRQEFANQVFSNFSEEERQQFESLLLKLGSELEKILPQQWEEDPLRGHARHMGLEPFKYYTRKKRIAPAAMKRRIP